MAVMKEDAVSDSTTLQLGSIETHDQPEHFSKQSLLTFTLSCCSYSYTGFCAFD